MNVHLKQNFILPAAVYDENQLTVTIYNINIKMVTVASDINDLNTASKRIDWFVCTALADAVFVNQTHSERNTILALLGLNVVTLPDTPVDQLVGIMLSCKLNAITEGRLEVVETAISSDHSNGLWFGHSIDQSIGPFEASGWWHEPTVDHNNIVFDNNQDNVVKVPVNAWLEHELAWSSSAADRSSAKIIVGNFNKKHDR